MSENSSPENTMSSSMRGKGAAVLYSEDSTASRSLYLEASSRWAGVLAGDFDVVTNLDNFAEPTLAAASTKTMSLNNPLLAGLNLQKQTRHGKTIVFD